MILASLERLGRSRVLARVDCAVEIDAIVKRRTFSA